MRKFLGYPGLEPGTNRLKAEYSTIELVTLVYILLLKFLFCKKIFLQKRNFKLQKNLKSQLRKLEEPINLNLKIKFLYTLSTHPVKQKQLVR